MNSSNSLFIPIEKVIFLEGKKKGMQEGNELIKIRKIRSIVLYHETSIQVPWFSYEIMAVNLVYENYHTFNIFFHTDVRSHCHNGSHCKKKLSFPLGISSVQLTKSAFLRIRSHLLKKSLMENFIFFRSVRSLFIFSAGLAHLCSVHIFSVLEINIFWDIVYYFQ